MLKRITNYKFYEDKSKFKILANFYTAHADSYPIGNPVILYLGKNGRLFRITAYSKGDACNAFKCFKKRWYYEIAEGSIVKTLSNELEVSYISYGYEITFSHQFPLNIIESFIWYVSIAEEDYYA